MEFKSKWLFQYSVYIVPKNFFQFFLSDNGCYSRSVIIVRKNIFQSCDVGNYVTCFIHGPIMINVLVHRYIRRSFNDNHSYSLTKLMVKSRNMFNYLRNNGLSVKLMEIRAVPLKAHTRSCTTKLLWACQYTSFCLWTKSQDTVIYYCRSLLDQQHVWTKRNNTKLSPWIWVSDKMWRFRVLLFNAVTCSIRGEPWSKTSLPGIDYNRTRVMYLLRWGVIFID